VKSSNGTAGRFSYQLRLQTIFDWIWKSRGSKVSECYNGKSAWRLDARGLRTLLGDEAKRLRLEALLSSGRLNTCSAVA